MRVRGPSPRLTFGACGDDKVVDDLLVVRVGIYVLIYI